MINESVKLAHSFLISIDWRSVKCIVNSENLLQYHTKARSIRIHQELIKRLEILSVDQLHLLTEGTLQDRKHLLYYVIYKENALIKKISIEVFHKKYLGINYEVADPNEFPHKKNLR